MAAGGDFFEQFIEDYYAECDEHLAAARRVLLDLEGSVGRAPPDPARVHALLRSLHTLKGLSGMVGLANAERLAHAMEGAMRAAERAGDPLAQSLVDAQFAGIELLERCVAARRAGSAIPDVEPMVAALATATPDAAAHPASAVAIAQPADDEPDAAGIVLYRFAFAPSRELSARGVGVESIRTRLAAFGEIMDAKPRVVPGGVAFDFVVGTTVGNTPDEGWQADGLTWTEVRPAEETEAAPAPTVTATPGTAAPGAGVVRVDLSRLDAVMRLVGELVVSRTRLDDALGRVAQGAGSDAWHAVEETTAAMERQLRRLREGVTRIRLVPVGEAFERLRFAVRDAARESGRRVAIELEGQHTEIDKLVVDRMLEPLLHLVRNAVSHGIESPAERAALGKPPEGRLVLRAAAAGDRIRLEVEDDGAGIDRARVAARARSEGRPGAEQALDPDDDEALLDLLCAPGFSTRDGADLTSGRGVGMDVVRATVRALSGQLSLHTEPGRGTRFTIEVPLTLMILDALLVEVAGQQMAVPQPVLREILQLEASAIVTLENNDVVTYRGGVLPLVRLAQLFGFPAPPRASFHVLVVGDGTPTGLLVDRLLGLREIVVHPIVDPLATVPGVSGATELGDGRVSLILDAPAILRLARDRREGRAWTLSSANVNIVKGSSLAAPGGAPA